MERKIGEIFDYNGKTLKVVEAPVCDCSKCFFHNESVLVCRKMKCSDYERSECNNVYFVEV